MHPARNTLLAFLRFLEVISKDAPMRCSDQHLVTPSSETTGATDPGVTVLDGSLTESTCV